MENEVASWIKKNLSCLAVAGTILVSGCTTFENRYTPYEINEPTSGKDYAILLNGDHGCSHHEKNIERALNALKKIGYKEANIFTLTEEDYREVKVFKYNYNDGDSKSVGNVLDHLYWTSGITYNDTLLFYATGHGSKDEGEYSLGLKDGLVSGSNIAEVLDETPFNKLIIISDTCYSGKLIDRVSELERNIIAISNLSSEETGYCQPFAKGFWNAVGNLEYDIDGDGYVDTKEAFTAGANTQEKRIRATPQYKTCGKCNYSHNRGFNSSYHKSGPIKWHSWWK